MMKKFVLVVTAAALLIGLTACGTSGKPSAEAPAKAEHTTSAPTKTPASENAKFGQSYKWSDGLVVAISVPQPYEPTASAAGAVAGAQNILFKITVTNGTNENVDASMTQFSLTSGGTAAGAISDIEGAAGDGFGPQTPVLPGQSVSWNSAWSVKDVNDLTAQFQFVDFTHKPAIFTN